MFSEIVLFCIFRTGFYVFFRALFLLVVPQLFFLLFIEGLGVDFFDVLLNFESMVQSQILKLSSSIPTFEDGGGRGIRRPRSHFFKSSIGLISDL